MKFRAHDTFFIRKGWLSKGMKAVKDRPDIFVTKEENPMDVLGLGANMVKSLRYWLTATGLTEEKIENRRHIQALTEFGEYVIENDRYIEELGTLYLIHYKLASNKDEATAWYYFFNEFNMSEFTRDDFVSFLQQRIRMEEEASDVAIRSLNDDFTCIINTYLPRYKTSPNRVAPESNIDCPFGELGLIDILSREKKTYRKAIPSVNTIDPWVALAVIVDRRGSAKEISLNELLTAPRNIGKTFNLDAITMLDILYKIEKLGMIKIIRTAGLDIIRILKEVSFQDCVNSYYENIDKQ